MNITSSNNNSFPSSSPPYYEEMLKMVWAAVKRPQTYEYDITHGSTCSCCSKIKSKLGRKPGGHNRK